MSELQKVIKYIAMAFAAFLAFIIISSISSAFFYTTNIISKKTTTSKMEQYSDNYQYSNVKRIDIEHSVGNLIVKYGDSKDVIVEAINVPKGFEIGMDSQGELYIESNYNVNNVFKGNMFKDIKVIVYIPKDLELEIFKIVAGAGNVNVNDVLTDKLEIYAGAGNIEGDNITANEVYIDGGVGNIDFKNVELWNVDIDSGVGNIDIRGNIYGNSAIDCGVGNVSLNLNASTNDYTLRVEKGLGKISVNGMKYSDVSWNNKDAQNSLDISGGLGNIDIRFQEK